ncbi:MAG: lysophospholipase [Chloroflexota bacterium]|nr:lysophospholipase [Chloroflexota bacterium]
MKLDTLSIEPHPAATYMEAVERIRVLQSRDTSKVNPISRTKWMTHGQKVERVVVFFHGLTSSPQQFAELGARFYKLGYNVLIPRVPHHGLWERLTVAQAKLTAEELVELAKEAVDIAQGAGEHVTVVGFSMGGVMSAWAAQNRADVDLAVVISPGFGARVIPASLTSLVVRLALRLPNLFLWWDPRYREKLPGPEHAYPRFSTHAVAQTLRLGLMVLEQAQYSKPAAQSILVISVPNELAVSNVATQKILEAWRQHGKQSLYTYEFDSNLGIIHDLIDPDQVSQKVDVIYPILVELIHGEPPPT